LYYVGLRSCGIRNDVQPSAKTEVRLNYAQSLGFNLAEKEALVHFKEQLANVA